MFEVAIAIPLGKKFGLDVSDSIVSGGRIKKEVVDRIGKCMIAVSLATKFLAQLDGKHAGINEENKSLLTLN